MNFLPGSSVRARLLLLVTLAIAPMFVFTFYRAGEERRREVQHFQEDALKLARLISADQERMVEEARQFLVALVHIQEVRRLETAACNRLFAHLLKEFPGYANLSLANKDGSIRASGVAFAEPASISDRSAFERALQTCAFVMGECTIGQISKQPVITFGYPILDEAGQVQAVVIASMSLKRLSKTFSRMELPTGTTVTLLDHLGRILARHPEAETWIGRSAQDFAPLEPVSTQREGICRGRDLDETVRLFGFVPLSHCARPAYVAVGIPEDMALKEANEILVRNLTLLGLITLVMFGTALVSTDILILRKVIPLMKAARRLAEGDLSARTGLRYGRSELSHLARTFDKMAESLERRQIEAEQLEEVLRESGRRFRAIFNRAFQFTVILDPTGAVLEANQTILDFGELRNADVFGQPLWETPWYQAAPEVRESLKKAMAVAAEQGFVRYEMDMRGAGGKLATIDFSIKPLKDEVGKVTLLIVEGRDVTKRKKAEQTLRESEQKLRLLSTKLFSAQEDERKRISQELHDSIGQCLSAVKFGIQNVVGQLWPNSQPPCGAVSFEALLSTIQYAIDEVRRIMTDLRPSMLDDLGILATLGWFCREYQKIYSSISVAKELDIQESEVPEALKIVIFRIVQEAMHNIAKYSKASLVELSLKKQNTSIILSIEDDGLGFDVKSVLSGEAGRKGFGLSNMRERTELSGGCFTIVSVPGEGTSLRASWPCDLQ